MLSDIQSLAKEILLQYLQNWGQTVEKRIEILNKAVKFVEINATFVQLSPTSAGWQASTEEDIIKAIHFRKDIEKCFPIGKFELEVNAIVEVIKKYKEENK